MQLALKMDRQHAGWKWHCLATKAMKKIDVVHLVVKGAREENTTNSGRAGQHFGRKT